MVEAGQRKRILVVDDEADMRTFLANLLESGGFEPILACDGDEGLVKAKRECPAVIILDLMIAKGGIIQLYSHLIDDEELQKIPVIMLSTVDEKTFQHYQMMQAGGQPEGVRKPEAYLEKPPETEELLTLLHDLTA